MTLPLTDAPYILSVLPLARGCRHRLADVPGHASACGGPGRLHPEAGKRSSPHLKADDGEEAKDWAGYAFKQVTQAGTASSRPHL